MIVPEKRVHRSVSEWKCCCLQIKHASLSRNLEINAIASTVADAKTAPVDTFYKTALKDELIGADAATSSINRPFVADSYCSKFGEGRQ